MRKKFTMLLASLLVCMGAWAQVEEGSYYRIKWADQDLYLTIENYNGTGETGAKGTVPFTALSEANNDQVWTVEATETDGVYNLKSKSGYYITHGGWNINAYASPGTKGEVSFVSNDNGTYKIKNINASKWYKVEIPNGGGEVYYPYCDAAESAAASFTIVAVDEAEFASAITMKYEFVYGGDVKYTQETMVVAGNEYPNITTSFPYGVTATKPEGTVNAEDAVDGVVTKQIELLVGELPFTVSTLTDGEFGDDMSWYYLTMRSKDVTYDAATGMVLTGNVDEKSAYNYFAFTGNPFDGFSIYNYVAGSDKVFWRADAADGGRIYFTNTTETDGNTWMLSANGTSGYVFRLNGHENGYMNDHRPEIAVWNSTYGATDAGSTFQFELVEDPDLTVLYDITYEYVYGEDVKATQSITVESGAEYPACSYFAPYGVTVGAKPEGTVNASGTHQIELTVDKELPFETATDVSNIHTWYYAQMHMNPAVTSYIQDNNDGIVEWADKEFAVDEIDSHLWGFVGNVWDGIKVINKGTGNAIVSTSGSAVTGNAANATAFIPTTSKASNSACFCLKYPTNNTYLNAQGSAISSWSDNDNGSSFLLTEFMEKTVSISDLDYATLFLDYATYIPEGVEVYAVTEAVNGYATLTAIEGEVLPANTGVILKKTGTYTFKTAVATGTVDGNLLSGTANDTYVAGDAYVLAAKNGVVGLYKAELNKDANGAEGTTHFLNNANKAYLPVSSNAPMFSLERGEGTTSIENAPLTIDNVVIYDLTGRRVEKMEKGIYIVNGKKIIK